jgi:hypothetical protein
MSTPEVQQINTRPLCLKREIAAYRKACEDRGLTMTEAERLFIRKAGADPTLLDRVLS